MCSSHRHMRDVDADYKRIVLSCQFAKMYPEVGNLSPFQTGYPQYPMDSDFLQAFDGTNGLIDGDLQGMIE
jgi:hypothetical protein